MKKLLTLSLLTIAFVSCEQKQEAKPEESKVAYAVFGDSISSDGALTSSEMMEKFSSTNLPITDKFITPFSISPKKWILSFVTLVI